MTVFKNYFKILKSYLPIIFVFIGMFTFFIVVMTKANKTTVNFSQAKPNVIVVNEDKTTLANHFFDYIKSHANIVALKEGNSFEDALFFREVDEIITIPKGFQKTLMSGKTPKIATQKVPDSVNSIYAELLFEQYLKVIQGYTSLGYTETELIEKVDTVFSKEATITMLKNKSSELNEVEIFYNFSNYTFLATIILVISMILTTFRSEKIKRRNLISPCSYRNLNFQLFLGNLTMTLLIWFLYLILAIILFPSVMLDYYGIYFGINSFLFAIVSLVIGFLIGSFVKNKEAQSGIVNVLALGTSFISGAFVPQAMLGNFVIQLSKLFPSYWYIHNNSLIRNMTGVKWEELSNIVFHYGVLVMYIVGIFLLINLISHKLMRKDA
ncbi:MAG: ABC transporter permease [Firmicutes bacterium]|nr:ABC transporter permease [Bacillota bacterium]